MRGFAMPYPAGYLDDEREFINRIAARVPSLRAHFERCVNVHPHDRPQQLAKFAAAMSPALWAALDMPDNHRPSYAELNGAMARIAFAAVHDDYDLTTVLLLIRASHLAEIITGDLEGHGLTPDEITRMHELALRMMIEDAEGRRLRDAWEEVSHESSAEAQWTRDIRRIALAVQAEESRGLIADAEKLDRTLHSLCAALETEHGAAVMHRLVPPRPVPG